MIDLNKPEFSGSSEDKLKQLIDYTQQLHDTISRKFENIDITDLNYTLAEMIKKKTGVAVGEGGVKNITNYNTLDIIKDLHYHYAEGLVNMTDFDIGASEAVSGTAYCICQGKLLITAIKAINIPALGNYALDLTDPVPYYKYNNFVFRLPYEYASAPVTIIDNESLAYLPQAGLGIGEGATVYASSTLQQRVLDWKYENDPIWKREGIEPTLTNTITITRSADPAYQLSMSSDILMIGLIADGQEFIEDYTRE